MNDTTDPDARPSEEFLLSIALTYQAMITPLTGEATSLTALRGLLALMHGYAMLMLTEQFRRGGDLNQAYTDAVRAYLRGWITR
jgi:uncharacterized protein YhhL (DUF1145 family)